jgi:hypothetical protein
MTVGLGQHLHTFWVLCRFSNYLTASKLLMMLDPSSVPILAPVIMFVVIWNSYCLTDHPTTYELYVSSLPIRYFTVTSLHWPFLVSSVCLPWTFHSTHYFVCMNICIASSYLLHLSRLRLRLVCCGLAATNLYMVTTLRISLWMFKRSETIWKGSLNALPEQETRAGQCTAPPHAQLVQHSYYELVLNTTHLSGILCIQIPFLALKWWSHSLGHWNFSVFKWASQMR